MSVLKNKEYVFLRSDDSLNIYPNNQPHHFTTHLNSPLLLSEGCKVGLVEFYSPQKRSGELCIQSSICCESSSGASAMSLLRIIYPEAKKFMQFNPIYYIPLRYNEIKDVEIYITDRDGKACSFLNDPVSLTLCFK